MEKAINKYIYETTVNKLVEEKVPEKRVENGESIEVIKTIKKLQPVKIAVLRPDRKRGKEADIFYAKRLSNYLREGLLPHSLVTKRYLNDGGPLSEEEKNLVESLRSRYVALQDEYFSMKPPLNDAQTKRRGEIIFEMNEVNQTLRDIQSNYADVFNNTAEAKGKADVVEWWILSLSYADLDDKGYVPFFGEGDYDARLKNLDAIEAEEDEFKNEIIRKLSYFISFWHTAGTEVNVDDFKSAEENYKTNVSLYLREFEEKAPVTTEPKVDVVQSAPASVVDEVAAPKEEVAPPKAEVT